MDTICRLCAKEKPLKQLGRLLDDPTTNVQQKLIDCCRWNTLVPIEQNAWPKRICNLCYRKLEVSWSFAESVAQAQQELSARFGEQKSTIPQIEHVNIAFVKDEPYEIHDVFGEPIIDSIDTNAARTSNDFQASIIEPTAKLEVSLNQNDNISTEPKSDIINYGYDNCDDYFNDNDDGALESIEHNIFGTTEEAAMPGSSSSSKLQTAMSTTQTKSTKKKSTPKNVDVAKIRKESQKLPRSMSCICDTCGKELLHTEGLRRHLKIHSNELNYECKTCGKRFLRRDNLKEHENIHAGRKPYKCHLCDYRCGNSGNICKHLKQKHGVVRKTEIVWR